MHKFLVCLACILLIQGLCCHCLAAGSQPITACAIRWDAWYTNGETDPAHYTAAALSAKPWHDRAPMHAKFDTAGNITWAPSQETFDAEIRAAHGANLCWAYLMYGSNNVINLDNPMMRGLSFHRTSSIKSEVKYALMTTSGLLGSSGKYQEAATATVDLMRDSNYQSVKVAGAKRPLVFLFYDDADLKRSFGGSLPKMKEALDLVRQMSVQQSLGNPYIAIVLSPADQAEAIRIALGADAITQYIAGRRKAGVTESWAEFEPSIEQDWDAYASATSGNVIPTLRSGADIRARCQTPPPFEHRFPPGSLCNTYTINPTLSELRFEFEHAALWARSQSKADPAALLLVYAWSECDESGNCLMPTIGDPLGEKLKVISSVLR